MRGRRNHRAEDANPMTESELKTILEAHPRTTGLLFGALLFLVGVGNAAAKGCGAFHGP